jgi:hypothetical protein
MPADFQRMGSIRQTSALPAKYRGDTANCRLQTTAPIERPGRFDRWRRFRACRTMSTIHVNLREASGTGGDQ